MFYGEGGVADTDESRLIVIGSGVAGLAAALAGAERRVPVLLVTAGEPVAGSSWWAQGGIAAAVGDDDSSDLHYQDTLAVGVGLNDCEAVHVLTEEGRRLVQGLLDTGVPFDGNDDAPELGLEAGHSRRRILHAGGGATGAVLSDALLDRALQHRRVSLLTNTPVDRLLVENGRVVGVGSRDKEYRGKGVILGTGGYAGLWGRSTNPRGNRGIGLVLAWQAGAQLADLEFVQFHPTALNLPGAPAYLLTEALRGDGALLVDDKGNQVVNPLLPRDVVARALARHLKSVGPVYLTLRHLDPSVKESFRSITEGLAKYGIDLARDLIPVAPAAHYCMGGIRTDVDGRSTLPGLYAAGEVSCTGVQGANRLASNSLLECLVFGRRAALAAIHDEPEARAEWPLVAIPAIGGGLRMAENRGYSSLITDGDGRPEHIMEAQLGERLDEGLGVERTATELEALIGDLPDPHTAGNDTPTGQLVVALAARSALIRTESRGAHYRSDYPETKPVWRGRITWLRGAEPQFEEVPLCK
jgi:L-aspartate oxidase